MEGAVGHVVMVGWLDGVVHFHMQYPLPESIDSSLSVAYLS